jgi:hypothetical protein
LRPYANIVANVRLVKVLNFEMPVCPNFDTYVTKGELNRANCVDMLPSYHNREQT